MLFGIINSHFMFGTEELQSWSFINEHKPYCTLFFMTLKCNAFNN